MLWMSFPSYLLNSALPLKEAMALLELRPWFILLRLTRDFETGPSRMVWKFTLLTPGL